MTSALAALVPADYITALEAATPAVLINGVPTPGLSVSQYRATAPMYEREVLLVATPGQAAAIDLRDTVLTVALPHRLADGEVRWQVLLSGRVSSAQAQRAVGTDTAGFTFRDALAPLLSETMDTLEPRATEGWTVASLIDRLAVLLQAEAVFACDASLLDTAVNSPSPQSNTIGSRLRAALEGAGLVLCQELTLAHGRVGRALVLRPQRTGRLVALPWPSAQGRGGWVRGVEAQGQQPAPRLWLAEGDRPVVEDTFDLEPGWDPALQGEADSEYARSTSTDFSLYGSVYRAWVLNEDGAYNDAPFNLDTFDVGELFDDPGAVDQPLRFGLCLTRDASGRSLGRVIESSTDSGTSWSAYPGQASVMSDRAGVVLEDDTLPAAILIAAKAGTLRLRITATLTGPDPIQARRWDGNPFVGTAPTRVLRDRQYRWQYVAPTSIHTAGIAAGSFTADTADDRLTMRTNLLDTIDRNEGQDDRATLELDGAWTALRIGDRVRSVLGPSERIDQTPAEFAGRDARIRDLRLTFGVSNRSPRTRLELD